MGPMDPVDPVEQYVDVAPGVRLWTQEHGPADGEPLLLIMGAGASGLAWPDALVAALATRHRVIRYDHRDTGHSTWSFEERPYAIADLVADAVAVLDALGVERAHVVGLSLGGLLTQLLLADRPERLLSATVIGSAALSGTPYHAPDGTVVPPEELPGISPRLLELWAGRGEERSPEEELEWRVEHWRLLAGDQLAFDAEEFRDLERRIIAHTGHHRSSMAAARADSSGLLRTAELAKNEVPTLVVSGPAEPIAPPPHPEHLAQVIGHARVVEIPGMGHALPRAVVGPLGDAILAHTGR